MSSFRKRKDYTKNNNKQNKRFIQLLPSDKLFQNAVENYKELFGKKLLVQLYNNNNDKIQFAIELEKRFWGNRRLRHATELKRPVEEEDDDPALPVKQLLSGCRAFSTSVMFKYLKLKGEYAGNFENFSEICVKFPANLISGYNDPRSSDYEYKSTTRFEPGLNIVQISSFLPDTSNFSIPEHTFLVFNDNENHKFYLASSWYSGVADAEVTEPELKTLTVTKYYQLNTFLSNLVANPYEKLNEYVRLFFGKKNSLKFGSNQEKSFKVFVLHEDDFKVLLSQQLPKFGGYRKKRKRKRNTKKKGKRNTFKKSKRIRKRSNK